MTNSFNHEVAYYTSPQPAVIPGLKVAYGVQTGQAIQTAFTKPSNLATNWLGRLKNTIIHMVTEEAEADRPIGIAQLSQHTFFAHPQSSGQTVVQRSGPLQDYRFRFISEPRQRQG
jgi:hypothetical protein